MRDNLKTEGTVLQTASEVLANAGLNWNVVSNPVYDKNGVELKRFKAITREDNGDVFHIASPRYVPFQNASLFNVIEKFTGTGLAKYVRAGSYNGGSYVYGLVAVPDSDFEIKLGDTLKTFLRISTSHDGSAAIKIEPEVWRMVCKNGMHAVSSDYARRISVRHTSNAQFKLELNVEELLAQEKKYFIGFADKMRQLASKEMKGLAIDEFLFKLFEVEDRQAMSTRTENQINQVRSLVKNGKGLEEYQGTAYAVYNAVTEYVTHYRGRDLENRAISALNGSGKDLREKAFTLLA